MKGFEIPSAKVDPIMMLHLSGRTKHGKSHFGMTMPPPVHVISIDRRLKGVVQKFKRGSVLVSKPPFSVPTEQAPAIEMWKRYEDTWRQLCDEGVNFMVDTFSEVWELLRMAEFGKLLQVKPHHYAPINAKMNELLDVGNDSRSQIVLLHKLKEVWKDEKPTGEFRAQGFGNAAFKATVCATSERYTDAGETKFRLRIDDCGIDPDLNGIVLEGKRCNYQSLLNLVFG